MSTILGLFPQAKKYPGVCTHELELLSSVGFEEAQISVISDEASAKKILKAQRRTVIIKYAAISAFALTLVYVLLGLCARVCGLDPFSWGPVLATALLSLGELLLVFLGIILGAFIGEHVYEKDRNLWIREIRLGATVILVESNRANSRKARRVLKHGGAQSVLQF